MTWKTLQHPNILPLMGVVMSETRFAMVSDWMVNGNINGFVKVHPDANRLELVIFHSMSHRLCFIDDRMTCLAWRRH